MKIEHLSASRIDTFYQCQAKYYAIYEKHMKSDPHPLTVMGSSVHQAFEKVVRSDKTEVDIDYLRDMVKAECKSLDVNKKNTALAVRLSENAMKWGYFRQIDNIDGVEVEFKEKLPDGTYVKGFIDRLDLFLPNAEVIDLKTQKKEFDDSILKDRWQSKIYDWAVRKLPLGITGQVTLSYWVLRHRVQRTVFSPLDSSATEKNLMEVADKIRSVKKPTKTPSRLCEWCPAFDVCTEGQQFIRTGGDKLGDLRGLKSG